MGRVALVTGGSRGIGAAVVAQLVADGFQVASVSRHPGVGRPGVLDFACDVSRADQVEQTYAVVERELGPVSAVVANAGVTKDVMAARMTDEMWDEVVGTNLTGAFRVARRAIRGMAQEGWGRLVFIGSAVGLAGAAGQANYAASKAGLVGLARSLAKELGPKGITSNVVAPGYIETDMTAAVDAGVRARWLSGIPAGRAGKPDEVARLVAYLCSDDAAYINGAVIPIDGGAAV